MSLKEFKVAFGPTSDMIIGIMHNILHDLEVDKFIFHLEADMINNLQGYLGEIILAMYCM